MNATQVIGAVLIAAGAAGLAYGSFSYTKATHQAKIGPLELSVQERETVNVPVWAGGLAIVGGVVLLVFGRKQG
jgi:TRAP-type C4-dicarboxylate transport system permease small subunit